VIQKEARMRFRAAVQLPGASGVTDSTGFTEKNIVAKRKAITSGEKGERYIVSVAYKLHPAGGMRTRKSRRGPDSKPSRRRGPKAKPVRANDVAFMMEYGTSRQQATPWLRPAFAAKAAEAMAVAQAELLRGVDALVKKYGVGR
jgi:hypothetical protein